MVLKLNPKKCYFTCNQVTYLGHTITPSGLKPNSSYLMAEKIFLVPKDIKSLKQFLRLSSFYWWCVCIFAKLVEPCIGWQGRIHQLYEAQIANDLMTLLRVNLSNLQCWLTIMLSRIFAWRQMLLWKALEPFYPRLERTGRNTSGLCKLCSFRHWEKICSNRARNLHSCVGHESLSSLY